MEYIDITKNIMIEMCMMQMMGLSELSADPVKQRNAMLMKTVGAISALIVALINMFISGLTTPGTG